MGREAELLARMAPADAEELRNHLREMRSDRWAREVITQSVEAITAVSARIEALEKSSDGLRAELAAFRPRVEALIEAESAAKTAEARRIEAGADRAKSIGQGVREALTSPPALLVYGGLAAWLVQQLGVAVETARMLP